MRRYHELDSLRGLAALTVVFCHFLLMNPTLDYTARIGQGEMWVRVLKYSPLHIFWGGHEAVILFFMLSGFVLALPFLHSDSIHYPSYLLRRISRIYLPYFVVVALSLLACVILYNKVGLSELSSWFTKRWDEPISLKVIIAHLSLVLLPANYANEYNPVLWSLVHEMRISIIFPLLMLCVKKYSAKTNIIIGIALAIIGKYAYINDFLSTFQYLLMFIIGALLAKNRERLIQTIAQLSLAKRVTIILAGVLCYTYSWWFFYDTKLIHLEIMNNWIISIGAAIFILFALSSKRLAQFLMYKPIHFLGNISYSLYLFHALVLLALTNIFYNKIPLPTILILSFFIAIGVSTISYYFVETPSIRLGKFISSKLFKRSVVKATFERHTSKQL